MSSVDQDSLPSAATGQVLQPGSVGPAPPLTRAERAARTTALIECLCEETTAEGAAAVRAEIVLVNCGVAQAVAQRYRGRGIPTEDLQQVAYEGLVKAVARFDPTLDHDLLTYTVPTIRGELQRHFRDHGWAVRPPRRVQELQWEINRTTGRLAQELGREPTRRELVDALGVSEAEYDDTVNAFGCFQPTSLDQPVAEDATISHADLLEVEDDHQNAAEARVMLQPLVRRLSQRDQRILYLRFFEDRTQRQIGEELGVTQMQVSRLITRILGTLRAGCADTSHPHSDEFVARAG